MIPKIIHRCWIGPNEPPIYPEFKTYMPDWHVITWDEEKLSKILTFMKPAFDAAWNSSCKINAARIELIYRFGGIYVDTDIQPLRSFNELIEGRDFFYAWESPFHILGFSIFGGIPFHPLMSEVKTVYINEFEPNPETPAGQTVTSGPGLFTKAVRPECMPNSKYLIPSEKLYPIQYGFKITQDIIEKAKKDGAFCIHHWHASWKKEYNRQFPDVYGHSTL